MRQLALLELPRRAPPTLTGLAATLTP